MSVLPSEIVKKLTNLLLPNWMFYKKIVKPVTEQNVLNINLLNFVLFSHLRIFAHLGSLT